MAVYTEISDEALGNFIAAYDLGTLLACKGIAEGVENSNYFLSTDHGNFILTLYEKRVHESDLPFFLSLLSHVSAKGIPCPMPVIGRDGEAIRALAGRPAAIFAFLSGVSVKRPSPAQCAEVGGALAKLHLATADFTCERENALSLSGWRAIAHKLGKDADPITPGLSRLIADEIDALSGLWPKNLAAGVIHADLFPDNVFFLGATLSGVIDFYFACNDFYAYDIAVCLNAWCFEGDGSFNITKARAMIGRYRTLRPLSDDELAALPVLARGSALRFLLTRAHDWIFRDQQALVRLKDPMEYVGKLRFHQAVRDAAAYGL